MGESVGGRRPPAYRRSRKGGVGESRLAHHKREGNTRQVVVVGVEPLAQLEPPLRHRVRAAAGHGEVADQRAGGQVVEPVLCLLGGRGVGGRREERASVLSAGWAHRLGTQPRYSIQLRHQSARTIGMQKRLTIINDSWHAPITHAP